MEGLNIRLAKPLWDSISENKTSKLKISQQETICLTNIRHHKRSRKWEHDGLTGDTEAIKAVWQLQGEEPTKQTSNGGHRHEGPAHRLWDLTDGGVRSSVTHHDVGVQVDAV